MKHVVSQPPRLNSDSKQTFPQGLGPRSLHLSPLVPVGNPAAMNLSGGPRPHSVSSCLFWAKDPRPRASSRPWSSALLPNSCAPKAQAIPGDSSGKGKASPSSRYPLWQALNSTDESFEGKLPLVTETASAHSVLSSRCPHTRLLCGQLVFYPQKGIPLVKCHVFASLQKQNTFSSRN